MAVRKRKKKRRRKRGSLLAPNEDKKNMQSFLFILYSLKRLGKSDKESGEKVKVIYWSWLVEVSRNRKVSEVN